MTRFTLASLALALVGCVTPKALLARGEVQRAWVEASKAGEGTRAEIERDILEQEGVTFTLEAIEVDELARLVGGHLTRLVTPEWVLHRATATSRGHFPYVSVDVVVGRETKELPGLPMTPEWLSAATGERFPETREVPRYGSPLCGASPVLCLVLFPVALMTIERQGSGWVKPDDDEVMRKAPHAARLARLLADDCTSAHRCVRYLLLRRPLHDDEPLSVRVEVNLSSRNTRWNVPSLSMQTTLPLPAGGPWGARFPLQVKLTSGAGAALLSAPRSIRFCSDTKRLTPERLTTHDACFIELATGAPSTWGLTLPATTAPAREEGALALQWRAVIEAIDLADEAVTGARFEPRSTHFGVPLVELARARAAFGRAVLVAGPDDVRFRALASRLDDLDRRAHLRTLEGLNALEGSALLGSRAEYALRVSGVDCSIDPCQVDIVLSRLEAHGGRVEFLFVFDDGRVSEARRVPITWAAGEARLRLVPAQPPGPGAVPIALVQKEFFTSKLIRLER
ncbi:MAG: hypothetical protein Q8S33_11105 [Myxococcales bacterium]|nr:hypothetical protein [Myxococcales bacterium]